MTAPAMTPAQAIEFVRHHGVVLESAKGPVPSLAEAIAGGSISGSWWSHPQGRNIFALTRAVRDCKDVLVCRLVDGKITFVHRRLWPALAAAARRFPAGNLALIVETHTEAGRHKTEEVPYPDWVPTDAAMSARTLDEAAALAMLGAWATDTS